MRWLRICSACALLWVGVAAARPALADVAAPDQAAIQGVISAQIDAFRHDNAARAFGFASPDLQEQLGTAKHFMDMVQRQYTPVYRPRSFDFAQLSDETGAVLQSVELTGPDGLAYTARYTMERQADGSWRISACELMPSRRVGA